MYRWMARQTGRQAGRQTDRRTDRQTTLRPTCHTWSVTQLCCVHCMQMLGVVQDVPPHHEAAALHAGQAERHAQRSEVAGPAHLIRHEWHSVAIRGSQVFCHIHEVCLANASMALALSAQTPWVQLVPHVGACWLTGLGFRHT